MELETSTHSQAPPARLRARYLHVTFFFARLLLSLVLWDLLLRRVGLRSLSRRTAPRRHRRAARRFRRLATRMGGVWIKVGQFLSARLDVLPDTVTSELAGLQDEVEPEPFEAVRAVVERAFDLPLEKAFHRFEPQPLASASLGQVHRAELPEGDPVVVKVQRSHIHDLIRVDLAAMQTVVNWLKRYRPITQRADLDALVEEFSRTLWEEVDYLNEAEHARRFKAMFTADPGVYIPSVHASHTTATVLTLEDVYHIKISDYAAIEAAGVDRAEVAHRLIRTYLHQIFVEGFFHADPHPGNLFVEPLPEGDWRLVFVDFGMAGQLTEEMKGGLRDLVIAVGTRDLDRLLQAYQDLGVLLPGADLERVRQAEAALFERFWGKSMSELVRIHPQEMRRFARQFRDVLYRMPFQIPDDIIFLGRCVGILSGMCTGLDPDFNVFEELQPFAQRLLAKESGDWLEQLLEVLAEQGRSLLTLPARMDTTLARIERGDLTVQARAAPELQQQLQDLTHAVNRLVGAIIFAALLLVGVLSYAAGKTTWGAIGMGLAFLTLLITLFG